MQVAERYKVNASTWARPFTARLLEPGAVSYKDVGCGTSLLTKETIDRCIRTFIGCPVVVRRNDNGKLIHPGQNEVTPGTMKTLGSGYITEVFYNSTDGWWYGRGVVDTDEAVRAIEIAGLCSTGYHVNSSGPGRSWHDIQCHDEILDFSGEHLAVVANPRYEEATIRLNAKNTNNMDMIKWIKKVASGVITPSATPAAPAAAAPAADDKQNANSGETISPESTFDVPTADGKTEQVTLAKLIEAHNAKNSHTVDGEDEIHCNGKAYKVNALLQAFDLWEVEKTKQNAADEEKAKKDKEDKENAAKADKTNAKPDHFSVLLNAAAVAAVPSPIAASFDTQAERLARGSREYGSGK